MAPKKVLLVEGKDDVHVVRHLCGNRNGPHIDVFRPHDSVENLLDSFPISFKACEEGDIFGVIIDADLNLSWRWESVRNQLLKLEYENVPKTPAYDGTILDPPADKLLPRVGFWIMPDNRINGILEDFLQFLVPVGSLLFEHVILSIEGIPENEIKFTLVNKPKVIMHTWLAWQSDPGRPFGTAIKAKFLDPDVPQVGVLVDWLNRLFLDDPTFATNLHGN